MNFIFTTGFFYSEKIDELIEKFEPINPICFSAALNMFYQTMELEDIFERTRKELSILGFKRYSDGGHILFHRSSLLYIISRLIRRDSHGEVVITGPSCNKNATKDYYYCLSIINSMISINDHEVLVAGIIREHPPIYFKETAKNYYTRWLIRYWNIYTVLIHDLSEHDKEKIVCYLSALEKDIEMSIEDYFKITIIIVNWFISRGFDIDKPESFYFNKNKFKKIKSTSSLLISCLLI